MIYNAVKCYKLIIFTIYLNTCVKSALVGLLWSPVVTKSYLTIGETHVTRLWRPSNVSDTWPPVYITREFKHIVVIHVNTFTSKQVCRYKHLIKVQRHWKLVTKIQQFLLSVSYPICKDFYEIEFLWPDVRR